MNKKLGRNDSCHCGSGKKYKVCHGKNNIKSLQFWILILIIILGLCWYLLFQSAPTVKNNNNMSDPFIPQPKNKLSPPTESAPPGKVWSPEHQHWHDDPKASKPRNTNAEQNKPVSKPPGTPPPGKVWSPEHQHWHDKK